MAKYPGKGIGLSIDSTATPGTFTELAQVRSVDGPSLTGNPIDVTTNKNEAAEFLGGIPDGGELTLELVFDPQEATHGDGTDGLIDLWKQAKVHPFRLSWQDTGSTLWDVTALVTNFAPSSPYDDALTAALTLKVSGLPNFAATAGP